MPYNKRTIQDSIIFLSNALDRSTLRSCPLKETYLAFVFPLGCDFNMRHATNASVNTGMTVFQLQCLQKCPLIVYMAVRRNLFRGGGGKTHKNFRRNSKARERREQTGLEDAFAFFRVQLMDVVHTFGGFCENFQ